jgi:pimeloyl-ACP methyl ester carboxylesterase
MVSFTTSIVSPPSISLNQVRLSNGVTLNYAHQGPPTGPAVLLLHGYSDSWFSFSRILPLMSAQLRIIAPDLRGHGDSDRPQAGYRMSDLADDVVRLMDAIEIPKAVVVGHSMGAHVALMCAERHPASVDGVVLVDGGTPLEIDPDADPTQVLEDVLGPALARLQKVWPDRVTYHAMWSAHPAFAGGLTPDMERYVLSDLAPCDGGFRSIVSEQAVRTDGTELLTDDEVRALFDRHTEPMTIIRAETGLMAAPPPFVDERFVALYPQHDWRFVGGSNHYSVLFGEPGASEIAAALREAVASSI